jgi:hypothetical protein
VTQQIELLIEELALEETPPAAQATADAVGVALRRLLERRGVPPAAVSAESVAVEASPAATGGRSARAAEPIALAIYRALEESGR